MLWRLAQDLAAALAKFAPPGSQITVVNPTAPKGLPKKKLGGVRFSFIEGLPSSHDALLQAGVDRWAQGTGAIVAMHP